MLASAFLLLSISPSVADNAELDPSGGSYCGIYAVFGALRAIGVKLDFNTLLERKYVGSTWGSSLAELRLAVEDAGARATPLEALTTASIRFLQSPLILHVRPPGRDTEYFHWILVLGLRNGRAVVVDAPDPPHDMEIAQLLAASDGMGLYVRRRHESATPMILASRLALTPTIFGCALALVVAGLFVRRYRPSLGLTAAIVVAIAGAAAAVAHFGAGGFYRNQAAVAYVRGRHFAPTVPELALGKLKEMVGDPGVTLIDARIPADFKDGNLPGAINLPVFSGMVGRDRAAGQLKTAKTVVVYCQGASCGWAQALAGDLALRGVSNVRLFKEGWKGWESMQPNAGVNANADKK